MKNIVRRGLASAAMLALAVTSAKAATPVYQFPTTPWAGYAPAIIECGVAHGVNMNSTADQMIPISVPSATYTFDSIVVSNASISLTTAAGGIYAAPAKAGTGIVAAGQAYSTLTAAANDAAGSVLALTLNNTTAVFDLPKVYLSLTTAQGAAATADVRVFCKPLY